jgi:RNA polymerase sigma-70 factor, ECF subfamily
LSHREQVVRSRIGRRIIAANADAHLSDAALVDRAIAGDRWSKETIFRRHVAAVAATVKRLLGKGQDGEDVVQEAFAIAFSELERLRDPEALRAWLIRIAIHKVHRRFRRRRLLRILGFTPADEGALADLAAAGATPEMRAELALLDRALIRLSAKERLVWMLRHVEGETIEAIAIKTACSIATVKRRLKVADRRVEAHVERDRIRGLEA